MTRSLPCDCAIYPRLHDSRGVCVNHEQHAERACDEQHTIFCDLPTFCVWPREDARDHDDLADARFYHDEGPSLSDYQGQRAGGARG